MILLRMSGNLSAEFSFSDPGTAHCIILETDAETLTDLQTAHSKLQRAGFRSSFLICQTA
jgi:hypothetical protein